MEKFKEGTVGHWIARIRDPIIKKEIIADSDYEHYKNTEVNGLRTAIIYSTNKSREQDKFLEMETLGIELANHPIYDSIGELPEEYQIHAPHSSKADEFRKFLKIVKSHGHFCDGGVGTYYAVTKEGIDMKTGQWSKLPVYEYEDWKRILTGEQVKEEIVPVGEKVEIALEKVPAVGTWVMPIDKDVIDDYPNGPYILEKIDVNNNCIWIMSGIELVKHCTKFRLATLAEIVTKQIPVAPVKDPEYKVGDWVVIINEGCCTKGVKLHDVVQIKKVISEIPNWEFETTKGKIASYEPINTRIRLATQSEIDAATGKQQEIVVGTWVTMLDQGCHYGPGRDDDIVGNTYKIAKVLREESDAWKYELENAPKGTTAVGQSSSDYGPKSKFIRIATEAEIQAHLTKDKVIIPKVEKVAESDYKVGDWIYIIDGRCRIGPGMRGDELRGNVYRISNVINNTPDKWKYELEGNPADSNAICYSDINDRDSYIRLAKPHEIPQPTPTSWSAVTTDGVTVYKGEMIWWVNPQLGSPFQGDTANMERSMEQGYTAFSSKEAADRYIAEKRGKKVEPVEVWGKDEWQKGDILEEKWLNTINTYSHYKGSDRGTTDFGKYGKREVKEVKDGWALISGTRNIWLKPKSNYPTYNQVVTNNNNQSQSLTKTKTETSYEKGNNININSNTDNWISSKEELICTKNKSTGNKCIDISANTESVIISKGRNSTAICDPGQPEYIV